MAETKARQAQQRRSAANYYSQTSEAYDAYDNVYTQTEAVPLPQRRTVIKRKKHRGPKYLHMLGQNEHSVLIYLSVALVFCGCLALVLAAMNVNVKQRGINDLKLQLKTAQESNIALKAEVSESLDLAEVEQIAKVKLGMHSPETYQLRYITVPNETHLVQHKPEEEIVEDEVNIASFGDLFFRED